MATKNNTKKATKKVTPRSTVAKGETPLFKIEFDPTIDAMIKKGKNRHLVQSLVSVMEKLEVNKGHVKIEIGGTIENEKDARLLSLNAVRYFKSLPKCKHAFRTNGFFDAKKQFTMLVIKRIA